MFGGLSCGSESNLRKRSERKGVLGRGRSHIAPESSPSFPCPSLQQSQWANLPPELLIDIIRRLESSETLWPARRDVVSCAAVCRSWREVTKEVVRTPEQCGLITFPMSLKQVNLFFEDFCSFIDINPMHVRSFFISKRDLDYSEKFHVYFICSRALKFFKSILICK